MATGLTSLRALMRVPGGRFLLSLMVTGGALAQAAAADLDARIEQVLAGVPRGGLTGVAVFDLRSNTWLARHDASTPLTLASTTKSLVAAAALTQFGPNFQFRTQIYSVGPLAAHVAGLGVIGGGDPTFDGHFSDDEPEKFFVDWAAQLKRQGIVAIDGDIVIDNRLFNGPIRPSTYPQDTENLQRWYSAPASAFAWNDNCIEVRVVPTRVGQPAEVQVRPPGAGIAVKSTARTVSGKGDKAIYVSRDRETNSLTVSGNYAQATPWFPLAIATDPDLLAGAALKSVLISQGISVAGTVRIGPVDARSGRLLINHGSPLVPALSLMLHNSQNFYGEQLLRLLGVERFGDGSIAGGAKATLMVLKRLAGDHADQITLLDGSGLSYGNAASAEVMVEVMTAMHRSPLANDFYQSLKERDLGNIPGRVKTGTLAVATCLVGYLDPAPNHRRAFAILFNRGTAKNFDWAPKIRDQIYRAIADD